MRAVLSLLGLQAAVLGLAAAKAATVRIPAPISIDDATSVTVDAGVASASPGVTAYAFAAQQSDIARASYSVRDEGDRFRFRMTMTVDGVVRNESEYHQTMTMEQACGVVTDAAAGKLFLDPCTVTANVTTGQADLKRTQTRSEVFSYGLAALATMGKLMQSQLVLDTVTVAGGKFVNASVVTPTASEFLFE